MFAVSLLSVSTTARSDQILVEEIIDTKAPLKLEYCEILSEFPFIINHIYVSGPLPVPGPALCTCHPSY